MTMMNSGSNRLLDELAKVMTDAAGAAQGVRREMETAMRSQLERLLNSMDLVKREEFEAVRDMAIKAREENDALSARLDALEKKPAAAASGANRRPNGLHPRRPRRRTPEGRLYPIFFAQVFHRTAEAQKAFCVSQL
jgi:BMFP domain-containing protein YqiC